MDISSNDLAAGNFVGVKNKQFAVIADVLKRKIIIIGTYDPAKTEIVDELPLLVTSPEDVGAKTGFGFMLHRLAVQAFLGSQGLETWIIPQSESGGAVVGEGNIDFTSVTAKAGTIYLYVAGLPVQITVADADDADAIAVSVVAAVNAIKELPVIAVINGVTTSQVDFTSKSKGVWGNGISLTFNWGLNEKFPDGVAATVTPMASGTGIPVITAALTAMGTGDNQNEKHFTDFIYGYGSDSTTDGLISTYNGIGNDFVGNYSKTTARPFRAWNGDVATGSAGLSAIVAIGDAQKETNRTLGTVCVPGSPNHPEEIAALGMAIMARLNNKRAEETPIGQILPGIIPGLVGDGTVRWTDLKANRETAVNAGISPTTADNNVVKLSNVLTYYHPDSVNIKANGYRSQRNISILQNYLNAVYKNFAREKWQGITIVQDVARVGNTTSREKVRDVSMVTDDLLALASAFKDNAWIFSEDFTIEQLQAGDKVEVRSGGDGFNSVVPVLLSGEGGILNTQVEFDASLAILLG